MGQILIVKKGSKLKLNAKFAALGIAALMAIGLSGCAGSEDPSVDQPTDSQTDSNDQSGNQDNGSSNNNQDNGSSNNNTPSFPRPDGVPDSFPEGYPFPDFELSDSTVAENGKAWTLIYKDANLTQIEKFGNDIEALGFSLYSSNMPSPSGIANYLGSNSRVTLTWSTDTSSGIVTFLYAVTLS